MQPDTIHMPYDSNDALPPRIKREIPSHVQDIYRISFNSAWEKFKKDQLGSKELEEVADKAAWEAVKEAYHKEGDEWVRNET